MTYAETYAAIRELRNQAWDKDANAGTIGDKLDDLLNNLYDGEIKRIENLTN